ncbi:prolipoprotein diacylglyceryl transferase [Shewanella intestini]|uniref:Phosphatidylglycerol--prolipoprotein diacylglyceryl transferase n=1 Tax=Shewanella intestini TaxID=2017544 RepID=A0ABS5I3D7_9GAMM|nr:MULTISPECIES: prolipoprotein diacylglyceryl transferase [Shewanella]MBR9728531.1 prolipoprotein diacylglyceryl transferase [Shewanella intestini]MRG36350.1 prolipoprotein diacylglyceryl transferase [Shewanella sp. XMDDZSB0408]
MEHFVWNFDPILFSLGPVMVHWYGVLFATAISCGFLVMKHIYKREGLPVESLDDLLMYCVVGIIVGARLAHCFFYDPEFYLSHPLKILYIWEGGLASHGGGLGAILALFYYHTKTKLAFLFLLDRLAIATAIFGFFVRIANFANSEILGNPTDKPWGIVFARVDNIARHPAQLYEAMAYLISFVVLYAIYRNTQLKQKHGGIFGLFLLFIFSARWAIESVKVSQTAYHEQFITTGQALSIPFLIVGVILFIKALLPTKTAK